MTAVAPPARLEHGWDMSEHAWEFAEFYDNFFQRTLDTPAKAMRYFNEWPGMDPESTNFSLKVQFSHEDYNYEETTARLSQMTGKHYHLHLPLSSPPLWVIHKRVRRFPGEENPEVVGVVYIVEQYVYQVPSMRDLLASKLNGASSALSTTFQTLLSHAPAPSLRSPQPWVSLPLQLPPPTTLPSQPTTPAASQGDDTSQLSRSSKKKTSLAAAGGVNPFLDRALLLGIGMRDRVLAGEAGGKRGVTVEEREVEGLMGGGRGVVQPVGRVGGLLSGGGARKGGSKGGSVKEVRFG